MTGWASALYRGTVMHRRLKPRTHRLKYRMFQLLLDLDELDELDRRLRLFSRNRFNIFSFHDRDHGDRTGGDLRGHVEQSLRARGIEPDGGSIRLLAMPRLLGYVFNPLSVYFCHRRSGALQAIVYEVSNTFGGRHDYVFAVDEPDAGNALQHDCRKDLYVSPFLEMGLNYSFRVRPPAGDMMVAIAVRDGSGPVLSAILSGQRQTLSDRALAGALIAYPLLTLKVIAAIHWQALRLWLKGVRLQPRPAPGAYGSGKPAAAQGNAPFRSGQAMDRR